MSHNDSSVLTEAGQDLADDIQSRPSAGGVGALGAAALASAALAACGGGGTDPDGGVTNVGDGRATPMAVTITGTSKPDLLDAWRFLNQATFGASRQDVDAVMSQGYVSWLNAQFAAPKTISLYALTALDYESKIGPLWPDPESDDPEARTGFLHRTHVTSAWWEKALTGADQLRQRVAFALSEILVIAMTPGGLAEFPYMAASYYDLLLDGAFGSFKDLVKKVSAHPAMGQYLSHISNRKPYGNRIPDQNFAREIMQLFSIGLYKLNLDGSLQLDANGKPIETYTSYDVEVLSHVFTGWGYQHAFESWFRRLQYVSSQTSLMKAYPTEHSAWEHFPKKDANNRVVRYPNATSGTITLLGKTLNIATTSSPEADRQAALDILFAHQNVAPFIARQMIQRLVTSNPSKAYVGRVAQAFKASGLSLKSLVQAILLDTEARDVAFARSSQTAGKLREPILRVSQFMRAFGTRSIADKFIVGSTQSTSGEAIGSLGQSPMESPSVFNFFRPGYIAPDTQMARRGLVTPEMQIGSETETAAYVRFMEVATHHGFGAWVQTNGDFAQWPIPDGMIVAHHRSIYPDVTEELTVSVNQAISKEARRDQLLDLLNRKLFGGGMSAGLRAHLSMLADKFGYDTDTSDWSAARLRIAVLSMISTISPEYVVQR
ncbi:MAG: DUF1800 family protein [Aquabacterium sp.]